VVRAFYTTICERNVELSDYSHLVVVTARQVIRIPRQPAGPQYIDKADS
jgi:factor associated with neutral sphingomyelinase activation